MLSDLCRPMRSDKGRLGTHYRRPVRCFLLNNASRLILHPSPRILFLGLYRPFSALLHRRINAASSPSTCCSIVYLRQAPSTFSASRVKVRRLAVYLMFYLRYNRNCIFHNILNEDTHSNKRDRSNTHSLQKMSLDKTFDLTAGAYIKITSTHSQMSDFVPLGAGCIVPEHRTRLNVLILMTLALISRGVTYQYPSRGYTHPVTHAIELSHAACKM